MVLTRVSIVHDPTWLSKPPWSCSTVTEISAPYENSREIRILKLAAHMNSQVRLSQSVMAMDIEVHPSTWQPACSLTTL